MRDVTPNTTPDVTPPATPHTGTDPENRRPDDDGARAAKRARTVSAAEAVRSREADRHGETDVRGEAVPTRGAGRADAAGLRGAGGSTDRAARSGDGVSPDGAAPSGEAVLPGEKGRTSSTEPRGTTAVGGPTRSGAGTDADFDRATRGSGAGSERSAGDGLPASGEVATPPRHRDPVPADTDTVAGRVPTTAAAEPGGHGTSLLPVDECDRIASRMRHAVVGFVDGPRDAVAEADQVLEELAARFTDAVDRRRRTLRGSWHSSEGARDGKDGKDLATTAATTVDTEQLRLALRDYRELTERLLHL
ncbi:MULTISPECIES: hypothetical protein [unclassified Streptomyces]|uniref:hypothetical protein n=1 Tax=unclassified Streptomyces TaxID=2593676 RepID=UPI0033A076BC